MAKSDDSILHYGSVKLRVTGSGNLRMRLLSLDEIKTRTITPLVMQPTAYVEPTKSTNFTQQRAQLEIKTTSIDERFMISKVIIYVKPVASSFPGK